MTGRMSEIYHGRSPRFFGKQAGDKKFDPFADFKKVVTAIVDPGAFRPAAGSAEPMHRSQSQLGYQVQDMASFQSAIKSSLRKASVPKGYFTENADGDYVERPKEQPVRQEPELAEPEVAPVQPAAVQMELAESTDVVEEASASVSKKKTTFASQALEERVEENVLSNKAVQENVATNNVVQVVSAFQSAQDVVEELMMGDLMMGDLVMGDVDVRKLSKQHTRLLSTYNAAEQAHASTHFHRGFIRCQQWLGTFLRSIEKVRMLFRASRGASLHPG